MRAAFVDTSWLVGIAFAEPGHEALVDTLAGFDRLFASALLEAELQAACHREGFAQDASLVHDLSWVLPDRPLRDEIETALAAGHLRGADLWHVACALYLAPDPGGLAFLTLDHPQGAVARELGFAVLQPPT